MRSNPLKLFHSRAPIYPRTSLANCLQFYQTIKQLCVINHGLNTKEPNILFLVSRRPISRLYKSQPFIELVCFIHSVIPLVIIALIFSSTLPIMFSVCMVISTISHSMASSSKSLSCSFFLIFVHGLYFVYISITS